MARTAATLVIYASEAFSSVCERRSVSEAKVHARSECEPSGRRWWGDSGGGVRGKKHSRCLLHAISRRPGAQLSLIIISAKHSKQSGHREGARIVALQTNHLRSPTLHRSPETSSLYVEPHAETRLTRRRRLALPLLRPHYDGSRSIKPSSTMVVCAGGCNAPAPGGRPS